MTIVASSSDSISPSSKVYFVFGTRRVDIELAKSLNALHSCLSESSESNSTFVQLILDEGKPVISHRAMAWCSSMPVLMNVGISELRYIRQLSAYGINVRFFFASE
ncbi:hypothetical protein [Candidatus Methanarcanum hacksteinii]|uniref:hypothetical protein n=1 Tax=Candidatus Methanarcanum hacksteinii TaxID=2911857 RepID=UPI0037DCCE3E